MYDLKVLSIKDHSIDIEVAGDIGAPVDILLLAF